MGDFNQDPIMSGKDEDHSAEIMTRFFALNTGNSKKGYHKALYWRPWGALKDSVTR